MEKSSFIHTIEETVRFHEVDLMGVVNNAVYFTYFEDARLKYIQNIKSSYKLKEVLEGDSFFIMARNECDYIESAVLDDELVVYTKIDYIKNSSFGFKHLVENKRTGKIIAQGGGVMVHYHLKTKVGIPLPQEFYDAITDYENDVKIIADK